LSILAALFCGFVFASSTYAQPASAPKPPAGIVRAVLASTALPSVTDAPRYYKLVRVSVSSGNATAYNGPVGFVFLLSGSLQVAAGADRQILERGDGFAVAAGRKTALTALGSEPAVYLHFVLSRADELNRSMEGAPAMVTELYRNASPIPGLKPGPYEFSLVRVTFSPRLPLNPPHRRSGAALYYVLAGPGVFATGGKSETKPAGVAHFEPYDLVHQWGNPVDTPLVLIQANISQEGVPAVIFMPDGAGGAK
jgi:quercetin dioxygenase-like cupin family protein